jgi:preprotein translocase subunit SecE
MSNDVQAVKVPASQRLRVYLHETRIELRKTIWPTREEATNLTLVVLLVTLTMTVILGGLDTFFARLVGFLLGLNLLK